MSIDLPGATTPPLHGSRRPGSRCDVCGYDPRQLSPDDAVVALRSYPRRYRALLQSALLAEDGEQQVCHRSADGWSALEWTGHVRDTFHMIDKRLQRVLQEDNPTLPEADLDTPPSAACEQGAELVVAAMATNADQLGRTALSVQGADWVRTGTFDAGPVSALDLLREAVHEGTHHLRDVQRVLAEAKTAAP